MSVSTITANVRDRSLTIFGDRLLLVLIAFLIVTVVGYPILNIVRGIQLAAVLSIFNAEALAAICNTGLATLLTLPPSLAIAVPLAWLCVRTNMPGRQLIIALVGMSYVMPVLFTTIAYVLLFGKNAGLINLTWKYLFGKTLYDIYSFSGVVFVATLQCFPLIFFTTASGLSRMNPELEEAARIAGLRPHQVLLRITLAATLPSIMAGVAFSLATTITMLSGPLILGVPVGIPFLTTQIYAAIVMFPNIARAVALSFPLFVMTIAALWVQSRFVQGDAARFATVSGKGIRGAPTDLGLFKLPALILCLVVACVSLVFPFLTLLCASFMNFWWKGFVLGNFTLRHFAALFGSTTSQGAILNSITLSIGSAAVLAIAGGAIAIVLSGRQTLFKRAISTLSMLPLGIAPVIAGVLVILAWYGWPFNLGGTPWILGLGYVLVLLPYAVRTCGAALGQIDSALVDAARICGCTPLGTWRRILYPLMRNGLFTSFVIAFLFCIKEFPMTALVYSANTMTLAVRIYAYFEGGNFEECGAGAVVLLLITFVTLIVTGRIFSIPVNSTRI
jgi:iron(III) transport system permease protein